MKKAYRNFFLTALSMSMGFLLINGCTREDQLETIVSSEYEYGTDKIAESDGYNFDKTHSSVRWETAYLGTSALLTGRFNSFSLSVDFDQNNPANSSFSGSVVLSSVNTGEPGRDAGCLLGTFGTDVSDEATFTSTSIEKDGEGGYEFKGILTFHGFSNEVSGTLEYAGNTLFDADSGINGAPLYVAGFVARFEFYALSDFGIESHNIADRVVVIVSGQFKKPI